MNAQKHIERSKHAQKQACLHVQKNHNYNTSRLYIKVIQCMTLSIFQYKFIRYIKCGRVCKRRPPGKSSAAAPCGRGRSAANVSFALSAGASGRAAPGGRCTEITDAFVDFGFWDFRILRPINIKLIENFKNE